MSKPAVFGIAKNESQAQLAVAALQAAGFVPTDISLLSSTADGAADSVGEVPIGSNQGVGHENATKAPEGATTGGVTGGLLGGIAGWMVGIGALAIPGVGPFVAAGPILAALGGSALGAAAGGLAGALVGYGIPEYEAKLYADRLGAGNILIGVHAIDSKEASAAKKALENTEVSDIKVTSEVAAK